MCFSEKVKSKILKNYMLRIMNEENHRDNNVEKETAKYPVSCVSRHEVVQVLKEIKSGKHSGLSNVLLHLIDPSRKVIPVSQILSKSCRRIVDE